MLTKLNKTQKLLKQQIKEEWLAKLTESTNIDIKALKTGIQFCYRKFKNKNPKIFIVDNPQSAITLCRKLGNNDIKTFHYFGLGYDSGWLSFYDYFYRLGIIKSKLFKPFLDFYNCGAFAYIFFENVVIAIRRPIYIKRDANKRMHNETGPAIEFLGGWKSYRWHGMKASQILIEHPDDVTTEFIEKEKNSEVQRAIAEKLGWNRYLELCDVKLVDKWFDVNTSCHYELYDFKKRTGDLQPRLLKMESPEIKDGTRPQYIEPVPPEIKTCQAARRWQCDPIGEQYKTKPNEWIKECNIHPNISFQIEC